MKGRKPAVKPLDDDDVVDLPSAMDRVPDPPERLQGLARELWPSVVGEIVARNIYDGDCRDVAMAYCIQFARFIEAEDEIAKSDWTITVGEHEAVNPLLKISNDACDRMLRLGAELGLSPASRKRVVKVRSGTKAAALEFLKQA
jgi:P27 family predicted phage terminase small subunit